jgi:hypothetical protein
MKFVVRDVIVETLPRPRKGKGERHHAAADSPQPCWTTKTTCWCTCSGCTTLTHASAKNYATKISRYRNLEAKLSAAMAELRRRQTLLKKESVRMSRARTAKRR